MPVREVFLKDAASLIQCGEEEGYLNAIDFNIRVRENSA